MLDVDVVDVLSIGDYLKRKGMYLIYNSWLLRRRIDGNGVRDVKSWFRERRDVFTWYVLVGRGFVMSAE